MPPVTAETIARDLLFLGVRPGGMLLVHSSLSSMGHVPGGPETVIQGLLQALGDEGTLLLPALSWELVGPPEWLFDVHNTPCCVGAIPEHFRQRPGTLRSVHPTHSVCGVGPRADWALQDYHLDASPCGPHSPLRRLREAEGQVLFLGCGVTCNTSMHAIEEVVEAPYLFAETVSCRVIWPDGHESETPLRRHSFAGIQLHYERLLGLLREPDEMRRGKVLQADVVLYELAPMWRAARRAFAEDIYYFADRIGPE